MNNSKDKYNELAAEVFGKTEAELKRVYGRRVPFVMIYVHEKGELLTNITQDRAKRLVERALHQMDTNDPKTI